eukprot:gene11919-13153_t
MASGIVGQSITRKLTDIFKPYFINVINESGNHNVPKGSETHFKVIVVSDEFDGKSLIQRHRLVNEALQHELQSGVHALSIQAKTPQQWEDSAHKVPPSPQCMGGSKR